MTEDHLTYTVTNRYNHMVYNPMIVVVGCGGTGGFLIDGLCRMLPRTMPILLIDHDRVEPHNLLRQNFRQEEMGEYKSKALALRMARIYQRPVGYRTYPFTWQENSSIPGYSYHRIIVGCVDNAAARQAIAQEIGDAHTDWFWLDVGNAHNSGQVLFGNVADNDGASSRFTGSFHRNKGLCWSLPSPSWQQPGLLIPTEEEINPRDCAEAVDAGDQSPVINQFMAAIALDFIRRFLANELQWMALYADLDAGTMRPVPIEMRTVCRTVNMTQVQLLAKEQGPGFQR